MPTIAVASDVIALTCCADQAGGHFAVGLGPSGQIFWKTPLPDRGHGGAISPDNSIAAIFARRPGHFISVLNARSGDPIHTIQLPADRHTFGHGVFSRDGTVLFSVEHDFDAGAGVVGIYEVGSKLQRVGEYSTYGVGPHEMILMPDGKTLAVANGGILTHPDFPRRKLNLADMEPSLAFLNACNGQLVNLVRPARHFSKLSMRHLAADRADNVWIGCQYEGPRADRVPLLGVVHKTSSSVQWIVPDSRGWRAYRHYIGSVSTDYEGHSILVTSPRGGLVGEINTESRTWVAETPIEDVSGLAKMSGGEIWTDGLGRVWKSGQVLDHHHGLAFDNHAVGFV